MGAPRLGFACHWGPDPQATWSGTPWRLRQALEERVEVLDLDVTPGAAATVALKGAAVRRGEGRWVSPWKHSSAGLRAQERALRKQLRAHTCDAVVQIGDLGVVDDPYLLVQDLSVRVLLDHFDEASGVPHFPGMSEQMLRRRLAWQERVYEQAAGVVVMSRWLADQLIAEGLPANRIFVANPGAITTLDAPPAPTPQRSAGERTRLLLVGRDFHTKAGDVVLEALSILRRDVDPDITLTVAGPPTWPLPGMPPKGVAFLGRVPPEQVVRLYDTHDLFVMPSRLEGFGIVFAEALSRGLPCVGRNAFAMPELIQPGLGGAVVDSLDPVELAEVVADTLADDDLYRGCWARRMAVAEHFTWGRMADDVIDAVDTIRQGDVAPRS